MHNIAIKESASSCANENEPSLRRARGQRPADCLSRRAMGTCVHIFCDVCFRNGAA
jgi:hypothetical protein